MNAPPSNINPRIASNCLQCGVHRPGKMTRTFLGFQTLSCETCGHRSTYGLSTTYLVIYWVAIGLITAACIRFLMDGQIPIPGLLFFAALYGLWRDRQICREIVSQPPPETRGPTDETG